MILITCALKRNINVYTALLTKVFFRHFYKDLEKRCLRLPVCFLSKNGSILEGKNLLLGE